MAEYPRYVVGSVEFGKPKRPHHIVLLDKPLPAEVIPGVSLARSTRGVAATALCGKPVHTKGGASWPPDTSRTSWWQQYTDPKCIELWSRATGQAFGAEPSPLEQVATALEAAVHSFLDADASVFSMPDVGQNLHTDSPDGVELVFQDERGFTGLRLALDPGHAIGLTEALRRPDIPRRGDLRIQEAYARFGRAVLDLQRVLSEEAAHG